MSSGFVSGGTTDAPIERSDEWLAAQKDIDAKHARKAAEAQLNDGKSLYEVLQANKGILDPAMDLGLIPLKNQFRALDEDEIEFLDSVLESTRAEEDRIKRETAEGLELFRRQQEEADKKLRAAGTTQAVDETALPNEEEQWVAGARKRKRVKEKEMLKGVKVRRSSTNTQLGQASPTSMKESSDAASTGKGMSPVGKKTGKTETGIQKVEPQTVSQHPPSDAVKSPVKKTEPSKGGLGGLVDYGSDAESP
ncbi:hypothetical protein B7463_g386, partial [Scytalidium lignicola]